jgi:hypothetical protein
MTHATTRPAPLAAAEAVPPPRRGRAAVRLDPTAVQVVALAGLGRRRLARRTDRPGRPRVYSDASILVLALVARLWHLSTREACAWLARWPALAAACGLPPGRVIHPAHLSRRLRQLGPYPCWLLYLALVRAAIGGGLVDGRDVAVDSTLLPAWSRADPDARWSFRRAGRRAFGFKVHVVVDRLSRLPLCFLLAPANANDLPLAYPLLWWVRFVWGLPVRLVRADGAYWGLRLVAFIVRTLGARPVIPLNRKKQRLARVRHLVRWPLGYAARGVIERFFAVAKRYYRLDACGAVGGPAVTQRVTLTFCAILVVALAAQRAGEPQLRLSPTRVLAHYLPVDDGIP